MRLKILGSAAGGGLPQWNCACANCRGVRDGRLRARTQTQVAVTGGDGAWLLLNASPDLRAQIEATPELHPQGGVRHSPIAGVVLSSGDLDNVLGLLLLREFQPLQIFSTASLRRALAGGNRFFRMLERVPGQACWRQIRPAAEFELAGGIRCLPVSLPGLYPMYVEDDGELAEDEAVLALVLKSSSGKRALFAPSLSTISDFLLEVMKSCDLLLIDGTFWSDDELRSARNAGPSAREMGHLPISGPGGTLRRLAGLSRPRTVYIHVNNTNPILDESSAERRQVRDAGCDVAEDGEEFEL